MAFTASYIFKNYFYFHLDNFSMISVDFYFDCGYNSNLNKKSLFESKKLVFTLTFGS